MDRVQLVATIAGPIAAQLISKIDAVVVMQAGVEDLDELAENLTDFAIRIAQRIIDKAE